MSSFRDLVESMETDQLESGLDFAESEKLGNWSGKIGNKWNDNKSSYEVIDRFIPIKKEVLVEYDNNADINLTPKHGDKGNLQAWIDKHTNATQSDAFATQKMLVNQCFTTASSEAMGEELSCNLKISGLHTVTQKSIEIDQKLPVYLPSSRDVNQEWLFAKERIEYHQKPDRATMCKAEHFPGDQNSVHKNHLCYSHSHKNSINDQRNKYQHKGHSLMDQAIISNTRFDENNKSTYGTSPNEEQEGMFHDDISHTKPVKTEVLITNDMEVLERSFLLTVREDVTDGIDEHSIGIDDFEEKKIMGEKNTDMHDINRSPDTLINSNIERVKSPVIRTHENTKHDLSRTQRREEATDSQNKGETTMTSRGCVSNVLKCDLCDVSFSDRSQLECHLRVHSSVRPFGCPECPKRFNQLAHLNIHKRTHSGEKPFHCHTCGAKFSRKDRLRSHLRIHTGEKPYACPNCSIFFKNPWDLKSHLKKKHCGSDLYQCRVCHVSFANLTTFTSHWKTHNKYRGGLD